MAVHAAPVKRCGSAAGFVNHALGIAVTAITRTANRITDQCARRRADRCADERRRRVAADRLPTSAPPTPPITAPCWVLVQAETPSAMTAANAAKVSFFM